MKKVLNCLNYLEEAQLLSPEGGKEIFELVSQITDAIDNYRQDEEINYRQASDNFGEMPEESTPPQT